MTPSPIIVVGIAEMRVATVGYRLRTAGLGSCIGLTLFDPVLRVAGMAHLMLPKPLEAHQSEQSINRAKYVETGIPDLIELLRKMGAKQSRLVAKMAGGAQMFAGISAQPDRLRIGDRNREACQQMLQKFHIELKAMDVGGDYGRTLELEVDTGRLFVKSFVHGEKEL